MPPAAAAKRMIESFEPVSPDGDAAFARVAVATTHVAVMMVNLNLEITYVNEATQRLINDNLALFQKTFPRMDMDNLIGASIDGFHKNPAHQRVLLSAPRNVPHTAEITIGDLRFSLRISSVVDDAGQYVGNVLEWDNVTEMRQNAGMLAAIDKTQAVIEFAMDQEMCRTSGPCSASYTS